MMLKDKIALITGSAGGIGFAIAKKMAENGAIVGILDLNKERVESAVDSLKEENLKAFGFTFNVVDSSNVEAVFKEVVKEYGRIDILVNNAGITKDNLLMKMKESDWDSVIDVNLKGTFICSQKVCRIMMKQRKGSIINIASVIGIMGNAGQANYAASKGGIIAFSKSIAKEFSSRNIRVNSVAPGFIETAMTEKLSNEIKEGYANVIPLNRMGKPEDIANVCVFLASDMANYITGQTVNVDGGLIM